MIRGSRVLKGRPSLLHSTIARGLPGSYVTVIVCESPILSLLLGSSGLLVIFGGSVRGEENEGGEKEKEEKEIGEKREERMCDNNKSETVQQRRLRTYHDVFHGEVTQGY